MISTLFLLFGCAESSQNPPPGSGDNTATDTGDPPAWTPPEGGVISLLTRDGVTLAADYYPAPSRERGAVILIHMHPPGGWTRADWPPELVSAYTDAGPPCLRSIGAAPATARATPTTRGSASVAGTTWRPPSCG